MAGRVGHDVTILHGGVADARWGGVLSGSVAVEVVPALVHPIRPTADLRALAALRAAYRRLKPDIIHTHQSKAGIVGRIAADAVPGATVVHGLHILPFEGQGWLARQVFSAAERVAARRTDLMIAVSPGVAAAWRATGIGALVRVEVVPSGMSLEPFRSAVPPPDADHLRGTGPAVVMLAAFEPRKRHNDFLKVWPLVLKAHAGARLLLAGAGPGEAAIRAEVERAGLARACGSLVIDQTRSLAGHGRCLGACFDARGVAACRGAIARGRVPGRGNGDTGHRRPCAAWGEWAGHRCARPVTDGHDPGAVAREPDGTGTAARGRAGDGCWRLGYCAAGA